MIGARDRLSLPDGVELHDDGLRDHVRGETFALNGTAVATLRSATPAAAARTVARVYAVDEPRALDDVLSFCALLNARLLLNVSARGGAIVVLWRRAARASLLAPHGLLPTALARRRAVDTTDVRAIVRSGLRALALPASSLGTVASLGFALALAAAGALSIAFALAVGVALAVAVVVHELAHLLALRGVPSCVVTRGGRVSVVHRASTPRRILVVAASGPVAGLLLASCLLGVMTLYPSAELGIAAAVLAANALGLTTCTQDGRTLCGLP